MNAAPHRDLWPGVLLFLHPPLSAAYLLALRLDWVEPAFGPPLLAAAAPLGAAALAAAGVARRGGRRALLLLALSALELAWAIAVLAIVGFAIAWRSG